MRSTVVSTRGVVHSTETDNATQRTPASTSDRRRLTALRRETLVIGYASVGRCYGRVKRAIHESRSRVDFCVVNTFFAQPLRIRY